MAIVDFNQIKKINTTDAAGADPLATTSTPFDLIIAPDSERLTLYDPDYGYFSFGQSVEMKWTDAKTAFSEATFTIAGVFTPNAETMQHEYPFSPTTDASLLVTMMDKYKNLEALFDSCADAPEPVNFHDWGTENDPRCVALPPPLWDKNGDSIYAQPVSIQVEPGQWTRGLRYRAVLKECKQPRAKVKVNNVIIDRGVVNITPPRPILNRQRMIGCAGEVIQCLNYSVLEVEVTGLVPMKDSDDQVLSPKARALGFSLELGGFVNVNILRKEAEATIDQPLFSALDVDKGSAIEITPQSLANAVTVRAKARL